MRGEGKSGCCIRGSLWGLLPLAVIGAGAWFISTPAMQDRLAAQTNAALQARGHGWASAALDGRDITLTGKAPSQAAARAAAGVALGVWGVRRVDDSGLRVELAAPRVNPVKANAAPVRITGTWPEGSGARLTVTVAGKTYQLGKGGPLTSDGKGHWLLTLGTLPPDGVHDVQAATVDESGQKAPDATSNELFVDTTPPAAPKLTRAGYGPDGALLEGSWPQGDAKSLSVAVDGRTFMLGRDKALSVDGKGHWTLRGGRLADGPHDVVITVADALGNATVVKKPAALVVDTRAPQVLSLDKAEAHDGMARLSGSWAEGDATSLTLKFDGKTYEMGKDKALGRNGRGRWVLTPGYRMKPGTYALAMKESDAAGNVKEATVRNAITIAAPKREAKPVADTTPPATPTVAGLMTRSRRPLISGSWPSGDAKLLEVELAGHTYRKGFGKALRTKGDSWMLKPDRPLADGTYDVKVTVADAAGNKAHDASINELMVDATSPAAPTVRPQAGFDGHVTISGTWPEGDARTLTVSVDGKTYVLGAPGSPLTSSGTGKWRLEVPGRLAPGVHDVQARAADALGNTSHDQTVNEILIKAPPKVVRPKPEAKPAAKPNISCQRRLDDMLKRATIHFETDKARISPESFQLLDDLARAANSCPKTTILIAGHTDSQGSATYNQSLSERRAAAVSRALAARGVSPARLSAVGYGESRPVADNKTEEGRAKNRRIEFIIRPMKQ